MNSAPTANARARFVALNTPFRGSTFSIVGPSATIGRSPECGIFLDSASVSRRHALVEERNGRFRVRDLGSRNGIRVGGRQVHEAELKDGDVLEVGDVQLRFEALRQPEPSVAEKSDVAGSPRTLTGQDIVSLMQAQTGGPAAGLGTTPAEAAPEAQPRVGLNLKMIAVIVLALTFSLGAGALILRYLGRPGPVGRAEWPTILVKVGENKWIRIATVQVVRLVRRDEMSPVDLSRRDFSDRIRVGDDEVVAAEKYAPGELLIVGKSVGETTVTLTMDNGSILDVRVLVRGKLEDPLEDLASKRFGPEEQRAMAQQFLDDGRLVEREKPYLALQEYRKAMATLKQSSERGGIYLKVRERLEAAERTIDDRWTQLRGEITVAARNNDRQRQMQLLTEAVKLIPDPNDPRHQKAQGRMQQLVREELQEKERGR